MFDTNVLTKLAYECNAYVCKFYQTDVTPLALREWAKLECRTGPTPKNHHSFAEHKKIVAAIKTRDVSGAGAVMFEHIQTVAAQLAPTSSG